MALSKNDIIQQLTEPGIIAVVRARSQAQVIPLAEALVAGGVIAVEITMTTPNAIGAIREASDALGDRALVGVGTILDSETAQEAIDAGAQFVVTPILKPEIVPVAHQAGKPIMLGSYSPTEAQQAFATGCDFVKLFPADGLGATYIKAIRAPLPHLRVVPTGGVNLETMESFLNAGCAALGVGSSMITKEILENDNWHLLTENARAYVNKLKEIRNR
ncbi:bifunctional 4-hydroxy-2-oxoglutarate aldolase/2-dehydro-3-deoxy-phosphogluconate aldolase [bacterium]|jgi:2-dehydro-3-deoxyphosphogluconate aldolase / (4S)-4-hydroxy-2-oxoglutarate aldolase|nr:bifunctional 4-hydroxy-2-oxoglutarate aldolase/2-dehydro-3-deoxy-phosphogluconate aldolase [Verrucomicrobiota bacterium]MDA7632670.1 bifunctional 4-hydroxy-2-oxoglutarate aldolase/2-dehydro-3-deoxy-phosphogluconate aldolase [bacterium]